MESAPPLAPSSARAALPARALPSVRYLPVSLFGAVMSVAGLALAWRLASTIYGADIGVSNTIGIVALLLFAVLAVSYLAKLIKHPELVRQEFSHPSSAASSAPSASVSCCCRA